MTPISETDIRPAQEEKAAMFTNDTTAVMNKDLLVFDKITLDELNTTSMQLSFLLICMCKQGECSFTLGGKTRTMKKGDLLISLGEQAFCDRVMSEDFQLTAVLMSRSYAQDCIVGLNYLWPYLLYIMEHPVVPLDEEEQRWIMDCYDILCRRLRKESGLYLRETIVALTRAFYFEICNLLDRRVRPDLQSSQSRSYAIFDQFIRLVSQNFKKERSVEWYSNAMCLTPKHLSEVMKAVSGRTAGQWITTLVIIEIKTLLQNSSMSIKEVAQEMNFPNQSFLGKYFKNVEGISPSEFRKNVLQ